MPTPDEIIARRARQRARRRRRRLIATGAVAVLLVAVLAAGFITLKRMGEGGTAAEAIGSSASPTSTPSSTPASTPSSAPSPSPAPTVATKPSAPRPPVTKDYIGYGAERQAEMSSYALQHYGSSSIRLDPRVIVLHYTCGSDYASAHATFEANSPNMGVKPGVVAHYVIDKDGTIYQQLPLRFAGRHTVGLNYVAVGIECVQEGRPTDAQAVADILSRKAQTTSLTALVRWLMHRYDIALANVIGHGMANGSPYFKDLLGWDNSHGDWSRPQIKRLRALVKRSD